MGCHQHISVFVNGGLEGQQLQRFELRIGLVYQRQTSVRIYRRITMPRKMLSRYCDIVFLNPLHHSRPQTGNNLRV